MPDARHPKPYPRAPKHPKTPVNDAWRARVLEVLTQNKLSGRSPKTEAELARMIKCDKGGLHDVLHSSSQSSYKYARQVSVLLGIGDAMVPNPDISKDEWDQAVQKARSWPPDLQRKALAILRAIAVDDD